jgi:hypothetical protein
MKNERFKLELESINKQLSDGKITVDEYSKLLEALEKRYK